MVIGSTGILYMIVNLTYVKTTGDVIYVGITWDNGISYIIMVVTFVIVFGVFALGKFYHDKVKSQHI